VNYIGGYGGAMATNALDDPQKMSSADIATASGFGQRFATFLTSGKTPNTPYVDFTTN
jgi:NAD(P)H dehydrogenase (quinone)